MFRVVFRKRRRRRRSTVTKHFQTHKETARALVHERLQYWNQFYGYTYHRVAIRNQRRCWGSCSSKANLNFSYKILFLPAHLQDYIILHELCHLGELNHSARFWTLMGQQMPDYHKRKQELRAIERSVGVHPRALQSYRETV